MAKSAGAAETGMLGCGAMIDAESLLHAIAAFARHHPDDEATAARMRSLAAAAAPCSRTHFVPGHFTASACVLDPDGDSVLLVHHGKLDRWLQPGGHIEPGDPSLLAAAAREVREECGLRTLHPIGPENGTPVDLDVHEIPARDADPAHLHFDVRFAFVANRSESLIVSDESHAVRWVHHSELATFEPDPSVVRMIARARIHLPGIAAR